jgi:hypothetical protein
VGTDNNEGGRCKLKSCVVPTVRVWLPLRFEAYSSGCAWSFRIYGLFALLYLCAMAPWYAQYRQQGGATSGGGSGEDAVRTAECGGMRRRERVLLRLFAACGCVESFCTFRVFSTPRECTTFDGFAMLSHCCDSAVYSMVVVPAPIRMRCRPTRARAGAVSVHIWWSFAGLAFCYARFVSSFARAFVGLLL